MLFALFNSNRQVALHIDAMFMYFHFVLFNSNSQVALHIDTMFNMAAICISIELHKIVDGASDFAQFDVYCASTDTPIDICGETADVRVWRRCSIVVDRCRPDVEGVSLIRLIFLPKNMLS